MERLTASYRGRTFTGKSAHNTYAVYVPDNEMYRCPLSVKRINLYSISLSIAQLQSLIDIIKPYAFISADIFFFYIFPKCPELGFFHSAAIITYVNI